MAGLVGHDSQTPSPTVLPPPLGRAA
uniref:Uncharacterized protein n=1 Tax=Anguilla anguilla TaxID=7936 RepID=A0A0E9U662_ANGAN